MLLSLVADESLWHLSPTWCLKRGRWSWRNNNLQNPLGACILLSYTRWSPATTVRIGNGLFSPCLKWMKYLARFKTEGAEWKELKAKSVGCQRHSVLLQILPGNRDGLHFSRRHWLKSAWDKGLGTHWRCRNKPRKSSHACAWLPSSAVRFSSVEPSPEKSSRSAEVVRAGVEIDWTGQIGNDETLLVRRA